MSTTPSRASRLHDNSPSTPCPTHVINEPGPSSAPTSRAPTRPQSPTAPTCSAARYDAGASIALVGMRGTGMSTLAVMASNALGFRLLDGDQYFYKLTGLSRAAYKSAHGISQYRQEELRLMRSMLFDNPTGAVIVCGPGVVEGTGKEWLAEYSKSHPVVYIVRDAEEIQRHLRVWDVATIKNLIRRTGPAYRGLSSFEFYNLSDMSLSESEPTSLSGNQSPRSLALKSVEEDFLHLINGVMRRDGQSCKYRARHSLSSLPPEARGFTYALTMPLSTLEALGPKFRSVDMEADALELTISLSELRNQGTVFDDAVADRISRLICVARRNIRLPMLYHILTDDSCSWRADGVEAIDQDAYFSFLHHGLRLAPEYLCVDLECDEDKIRHLVACKGGTKILAHYTEPNPAAQGWNSPGRWNLVHRAQELGCDMIRICQEAMSTADNFAVQYFLHQIKTSEERTIPVIAYNTGRLGRMSCSFNSILSPVTHPVVRSLAPDCSSSPLLTVQESQKALFSSFLLDAQYFGIYGNNVSQSLSPAMHNAAFQLLGMPHRYEVFSHDSLDELRGLIRDPNFGGASITAPFKREVIPLVDFMSREARAIGAVNTLLSLKAPTMDSLLDRNRAGPTAALFGENTDWIGIHTCVRRNLSPINAVKRRTTALIVGAGGMARAAAYALIRLGVGTIFVHNRTVQRAEELAKQFDGRPYRSDSQDKRDPCGRGRSSESPDHGANPTFKVIGSKDDVWPEDSNPPTIVVSCVATWDLDGSCSVNTSIPPDWLASPTGGVVIELSYTPLETPLLRQVRAMSDRGWIAVDGLQVLPEQGMMQFEMFTMRRAPEKLMRDAVFRAYDERRSRVMSSKAS
ncbi:Quinate repressor protein [Fusarium falciforme]|uniref:Quinate repressor protein n=1 Tax=Fusarium falciforme TaxID=195108 RepID=UPI00230115E2|nr:Quinate repressor protein [Fusarium falciforme]WAO95294.1 Quinate repressor protein [Fusarium falciforme]